jgi:hypothetical protein
MEPEFAALLRHSPGWEGWTGVSGVLYMRRPRSSPPRVLRARSVEEMRERLSNPHGAAKGDRVTLVACQDRYTRLEPGQLGTVDFIDDAGTAHVAWDSGSHLGMVYEAGDRIARWTGDE